MKMQLFMSRRVNFECVKDPLFKDFAMQCYGKFLRKDWGDMSDKDKEENDKAVFNGEVIMARYVYHPTLHTTGTRKDWELVIIVPEDRKFMQIIFKHELGRPRHQRQDVVLYDTCGNRLS